MYAYQKNWVRLPLDGPKNARELGGYPTADGGQTAYHQFLRTDRLYQLSDHDVEFLRGYGVVLVVDLRSDGEVAEAPNTSLGADVAYHNRCLVNFDAAATADVKRLVAEGKMTPALAYRQMLDNKDAVADIFHVMATARPGCIAFHCNAGKDRTGVVAALLLMLAGVDRQDICTNYAQTRENLFRYPWYHDEFHQAPEGERAMIGSYPETMAEVYDYLVQTYGTVEKYLASCGVSEGDIAALRQRLAG